SSRKNLLRTGASVIPERVSKLVIHRQPLIVTDELRPVFICWSINRRVPALRGDALILEERRALINRLRQVDIDQLVRGVKARIKERDADNSIGRDGHLWLELVRTVAHRIIIHPQRRRPRLSVILRGTEQNIGVAHSLIGPGNVELARHRVAGKCWQRLISILFGWECTEDIMNDSYQDRRSPGSAAVR